MKTFRSIRRGVTEVIQGIKTETFGNDFKGSPLEFVLSCITEQKQVFQGAAHPFFWEPKLRIPDIYENEGNKAAFGRFLESCLAALSSERLVREILTLDDCRIKGLGPAVANIRPKKPGAGKGKDTRRGMTPPWWWSRYLQHWCSEGPFVPDTVQQNLNK